MNAVTSNGGQPTALARYLACRGFRPSAGNGTWLDRETGQGIIRLVCDPGEETQLISLAPRSACLYKAVFSVGTPDAVIITAVEATLSTPPPQATPVPGSQAARRGASQATARPTRDERQ